MTEFTGVKVNTFKLFRKFREDYANDFMLHDSLSDVFRVRSLTSGQIEELLHLDESVIKPILVQQQPDLNALFSNKILEGFSLLWLAVLCQFEFSIDLLVRSGADVNELFGSRDPQVADEKWTILHALVQMDPSPMNDRLIRLVMDRSADLQAQDSEGRTVLQSAVTLDRVDLTKWFLEKGVEVNVVDKDGMTPLLHVAKSCKAEELLPLLMEHGADVTAKDNVGWNVLHSLARRSTWKYTELTRALIEKGASLHARTSDSEGYQPIHWAFISGNTELVKLFFDHGAVTNVNAQVKDGLSLLHMALKYNRNNQQMLKALLKREADINLRTNNGRTALHFACLYFNEKNIELLLSAGASILAEDSRGKTPFALINPQNRIQNSGTMCMLRVLALIKFHQSSIELKDERLIQQQPHLRDYYRNCIAIVSKMKFTRLFGNCTFLDILANSHNRVVKLMRNPNFETNFGLYDLNEFDMYSQDILQAFKRAQIHYRYMLEQHEMIDEATYDIFPYLIVRQIVSYGKFPCCESFWCDQVI